MPRGINLTDQIKKIIIEKYHSRIKQIDIASHFNLHKSVVCKQINLYRNRGTTASIPKPGRPKKTTLATEKIIRRYSLRNPFCTAEDIRNEYPFISISVRSIRRRLKQAQLNARTPARKPFISKKNRQARLQFALEHANWTYKQWKNVLWSDESKYNLFGSDGIRWVRRPANERFNPKYTIPTIKHGGGNVLV